VLKNHLPESK